MFLLFAFVVHHLGQAALANDGHELVEIDPPALIHVEKAEKLLAVFLRNFQAQNVLDGVVELHQVQLPAFPGFQLR